MMFVPSIREIHVEPTTVCQAECPMCPRTILGYHDGRMKNHELSLGQYKQLMQPHVERLEKVLYCGTLGDPAATQELLGMIIWHMEEGPGTIVGINSNGALRTPTWWNTLAQLTKHDPRSYVVFSIDGLEKTNHLYRRNVVWSKLMENAQSFIDAGGNAQWDMLVFDHNHQDVEPALELARQMGFRRFRTKVTARFAGQDEFHPPPGGAPVVEPKGFSCMAQDTSSLYLSAEGLWYPCCYTHYGNVTNYDTEWGYPVSDLDRRDADWYAMIDAIEKRTPLRVCQRSCGTTHNRGQWTNEWVLDV